MVVVTLTPSELRVAATIEIERRIDNIVRRRKATHGEPRGANWTQAIEGAAAEVAVAKWRGIFWSGNVGNIKAADVGVLQVRSTSKPRGCLILHHEDDDDDVFILAIGLAPVFRLVGWIRGRDGKQQRWWGDPSGEGRHAFFVPQAELRAMSKK